MGQRSVSPDKNIVVCIGRFDYLAAPPQID